MICWLGASLRAKSAEHRLLSARLPDSMDVGLESALLLVLVHLFDLLFLQIDFSSEAVFVELLEELGFALSTSLSGNDPLFLQHFDFVIVPDLSCWRHVSLDISVLEASVVSSLPVSSRFLWQ